MKKALFLSAILALSSLNVSARSEGELLSVVSPDSLNSFLKNYLDQSTGKRFEDPKIPRFLISDRNDIFVFGVGGYVGSKLIFDYGGNGAPGFKTVDADVATFDNAVLNMDLSSSRFFFKILGNTKRGIAEAYIEAGFSGAGKTLALKKAYVSMLGFRVGISPTAFSDNQTIPVICDDAAISFNDRDVPMIAYSYLFNNGIRLQCGLEFPQSTTIYATTGESTQRQVVSVGMPYSDATLGAYYDKSRLHLYAGVIARTLTYYDAMNSRQFKNKLGYGLQLSGNYDFSSCKDVSHKIFAQAQYEYMMPDCFINAVNKGLTAIMPARFGWTSYDFTRGVGGQLGYRFAYGPNAVNVQGSANTIMGHEKSGFDELYKSGFSATANYMRSFWKYGTLGGELVYGHSRTVGGHALSDFRVVLLLRYDF